MKFLNRTVSLTGAKTPIARSLDCEERKMELLEDTMTAAMPPKVAGAINAVSAEVPKLGKGEKNTHGNYNFASIDDFLEAVRPICAKHGLIIVQDEDGFEVLEGWLLIRYKFTLAHSTGETWSHSPRRSIMVNSKMGAQAFGAAQSYSLKQFMRSLFQIATGEAGEDADSHPQSKLPEAKNGTNKPADSHTTGGMTKMDRRTIKDGRQKTSSQAKKDGDQELFAMLDACEDKDDLSDLYREQRDAIETLPANWQNLFYEKFDARMAEFQTPTQPLTMAG